MPQAERIAGYARFSRLAFVVPLFARKTGFPARAGLPRAAARHRLQPPVQRFLPRQPVQSLSAGSASPHGHRRRLHRLFRHRRNAYALRGNAYSRNFAAAHAGRRMDRKIHNEIFKKLAERHTAFRLSFRCFQFDLFIGFRAAKIAPPQDKLLFPPRRKSNFSSLAARFRRRFRLFPTKLVCAPFGTQVCKTRRSRQRFESRVIRPSRCPV